MDYRVSNCRTAEDCEQMAINVQDRLPELAREALCHAIELRAAAHHPLTDVERDGLEAIFAYERALKMKNGKRTRASRTWPMIEKIGIVNAIDRLVSRANATSGFLALQAIGLLRFAFEFVVLRNSHYFSQEAVERSRQRVKDWESENGDRSAY